MKPGSARFPVSSIRRVEADPLLDLVALRSGALVVPEDRRPHDPVLRVERHEAVHLPREADPDDRPPPELRERGLARAPPVLRVLLGPAGPRRRERVGALRARDHLPSGVIAIALTPVVPTSRPAMSVIALGAEGGVDQLVRADRVLALLCLAKGGVVDPAGHVPDEPPLLDDRLTAATASSVYG